MCPRGHTGRNTLFKRMLCVTYLVLPHLNKRPINVLGFKPTVDNAVRHLIAPQLNNSPESGKTIEARLWAPTKAVAHAAAAIVLVIVALERHRLKTGRSKFPVFSDNDFVLATLFDRRLLKLLVVLSEEIRPRLLRLGHTRISSDNTIRFRIGI
jgi:hypothetical protein